MITPAEIKAIEELMNTMESFDAIEFVTDYQLDLPGAENVQRPPGLPDSQRSRWLETHPQPNSRTTEPPVEPWSGHVTQLISASSTIERLIP